MKRIILLILAVFCAAGIDAAAQDVITRRNGEDIRAVIVEVTDDTIKYKREGLPDGPLFSISKADVLMVTYSDGSRDVFADYRPSAPAPGRQSAAGPGYEAAPGLRPGMNYNELLRYYDWRDYYSFTGYERYSPPIMGLCSFVMPGLGQMISGEVGRGIGYLAGMAACYTVMGLSPSVAFSNPSLALTMIIVSYAAAVAVNVSSIVDAVRVAKVKNMYCSDLDQLAFDLELTPYVDVACAGTTMARPVAGLSLRLSF